MFNINSLIVDQLPDRETDRIEYKSGQTALPQLGSKVQNAASAFWNSGGGMFIAGVSDAGQIDVGIPTDVGRQPIQEWFDQKLAQVRPFGIYELRAFTRQDSQQIPVDRCVLAVEFKPSSNPPHQSADQKYYIRAGRHSLPAPHDIVEALHARRHYGRPRLLHLARLNHWTRGKDMLHVEIVPVTDTAAVDITINLDPVPLEEQEIAFPLHVPIVDKAHTFGFRFTIDEDPPFISRLSVDYRGLQGESYSYEATIDASKCISPFYRDTKGFEDLVGEVKEMRVAVKKIADSCN